MIICSYINISIFAYFFVFREVHKILPYNDIFHFVPKPRNGTWVMVHTNACFPSVVPASSRLHFFLTFSFYIHFPPQHFISFYCQVFRTFPFNSQDTISLWTNERHLLSPQKLFVFYLRCSTGKRGKEWGIGIWLWSVWVINFSSCGTVSTFQPLMLNAYLT